MKLKTLGTLLLCISFVGLHNTLLTLARDVTSAVISIEPDYVILVKDEPVNISCSVKSKSPLNGVTFQLELAGRRIEFDMGSPNKVPQPAAGIEIKSYGLSSIQSNNVEYQAIQNVTVALSVPGQLIARCAGDKNAERAWTVIRVLKTLPTASHTNMSCGFALPERHSLISSATVTWQLPPTAPQLFNTTTSCESLQAAPGETLVCSTASLVPVGMVPTPEALLRLAGRYWCHLVTKTATSETPAKQTSSNIDFHSSEIEVRKCFPTTGSNCVADSRCAFRCQVYGWPFTKCKVDLPSTARKEQVKSTCRFEDMVVEVVLDPAYQTDAGIYNISISNSTGSDFEASLVYHIRIKDKLAPLWPFLGICGEVLVLCGIIFFFEKRHRKRLENDANEGSQSDQRTPLNRPAGSGEARQRITARS